MLNSAETVYPPAAGWIAERTERGAFCWLELATPDPAAALAFYTSVFDWESVARPGGHLGTYTALRYGGKEVAILSPQAEERTAGEAPHWTPFVAVEDADRSARLAEMLGGTLLREPQKLGDVGRLVTVQDPTGRTVSFWQPFSRGGAELMNDRGAVCWHELVTPDLDRAALFYCTLFGWRFTPDPRVVAVGNPSFTITNAETPIGTMREQRRDEQVTPGGWIPYFGVDSPERSQRAAERRGGRTIRPASESPIGHTSVLADPFGARFGLLEHPATNGRGKELHVEPERHASP
jgi:uncharacterized protein